MIALRWLTRIRAEKAINKDACSYFLASDRGTMHHSVMQGGGGDMSNCLVIMVNSPCALQSSSKGWQATPHSDLGCGPVHLESELWGQEYCVDRGQII
jgi:hypothetical protein